MFIHSSVDKYTVTACKREKRHREKERGERYNQQQKRNKEKEKGN